ncbi:MAG TPA: hypothetical protein VMN03_13800 [Burkholderiales bacterium]|nr:hypothetical protein [Burkholderiales bacterium]
MHDDTDPRAAAVYRALLDGCPPAQRLAQAARLSAATRALAEAGLRQRHPDAAPHELRWRLAALCYGESFAERMLGPGPGAAR